VPFVALQSFSQSLCDEKGVAGLLQAPDLAVSDCPEMGESGFHPPPILRTAEIASENDHVIARLEVLVPFRVELFEVGHEWEETTDNRVDTAIDAPVGESFGNIPLGVIRQERVERIHVSHGVVQLPDENDLRRIGHKNLPLDKTGFKLRRQSFCESHFDELFKRSLAFVDPRANQCAFPAIQNERGKCASRKVLGDLPLCLCLGNDVRDHRRPSRKLLGNTGTNLLALLGKFGSTITQQAAATELLFFSYLNQPVEIVPETSVR